jgi:hypothetical protein
MKTRPRSKMTQCQKGLSLRHKWADQVQHSNMKTWQHEMFKMHAYWKHVAGCKTCEARIKARLGEINATN